MSKYFSEELLQPISAGQPCGADLRYDPLFTEIVQASRADDELSEGAWEKEDGRKLAEWDRVAELCLTALRHRTKDLRILVYLSEASIRLDGFSGIRDCLKLTGELLNRFWDQGLLPAIDDGDLDYRASALSWFNDRMPLIVSQVSITAREVGDNYSFVRYQQALQVGTAAALATASVKQKERIEGLIRQGWITMEGFEAALLETKPEALESSFQAFDEAHQALLALEKAIDERFGTDVPLSDAKATFIKIRQIFTRGLKRKRDGKPDKPDKPADGELEEPDQSERSAPDEPVASVRASTALPVPWAEDFGIARHGKDWEDAEALIRVGQVDRGLAQMTALVAQAPSGRTRFVGKLMLCDKCLANGRDRLARTILHELNQQIEEFKLDRWESSSLVGGVWSRIYKLNRKSENSSERELAAQLYNQLCRLDPWQAYFSCED